MTAYALSPGVGLLADDSDRRFKRLLTVLLIPALIAGIGIPFVQISGLLKGGAMLSPTRYAKLVQQQPEEQKPTEEKVSPVAKPRPQLTQEQKVEKARKKAEKAMKQFDALASLRDSALPTIDKPLTQQKVIGSEVGHVSNFATEAGKTSGGIGETAEVGRVANQTQLGQRNTQSVKSRIGENRDKQTGMGGNVEGRSLENLQLVFDRAKGAFSTLYLRELRDHPNARGKIVIRMTIAPAGRVLKCTVISSDFHNPEFEQKVVARVMLLDFGPAKGGDFTVDYPMVFFPQN